LSFNIYLYLRKDTKKLEELKGGKKWKAS